MTTTSPKRAATFDLASASSKKARTIDDDSPPPPVPEQEPSHVAEPEAEHIEDEEAPPMGEHETRFMHARQSVQERLVAWLDDFVNGVAQEARALVEPRLSERFNQFQAAQDTARQTDELSAWNEKASAAWAAHQQQYAAVLQAAPQMAAPMASGAPPTQMMAAPTTPGGIAPETPGGSAPETSGVEIAETELPDEEDVEEDGEEEGGGGDEHEEEQPEVVTVVTEPPAAAETPHQPSFPSSRRSRRSRPRRTRRPNRSRRRRPSPSAVASASASAPPAAARAERSVMGVCMCRVRGFSFGFAKTTLPFDPSSLVSFERTVSTRLSPPSLSSLITRPPCACSALAASAHRGRPTRVRATT